MNMFNIFFFKKFDEGNIYDVMTRDVLAA